MALLPPLPADQWDDRTRAALAGLVPRSRQDPAGAGVALSTLVRHPDLAKAFSGFSTYLLVRTTLPSRVRELAILRVAARRNCAYEWAHHTRMASEMGLSESEINAARDGSGRTELDNIVFTAVDELDEKSALTEATWQALSAHLDERQRMDLIFTVGGYCAMAMAFNTFGVEPEAER